ncbi:MAG: hypothetical protein CMM87_06120 [Rickettsiales bacterium]|nr:hypothetical protein [Rickettsiales bacterium]
MKNNKFFSVFNSIKTLFFMVALAAYTNSHMYGYPLEYEVENEINTYVTHPGIGQEGPDIERCRTQGFFYDINRDGYTSVILCFRTPEPVGEERKVHDPRHPLLIFQMQNGQNYYYEGLHFVNRSGDVENGLGTNANIVTLNTEEVLKLCHRAKKETRKYRQKWRKESKRSHPVELESTHLPAFDRTIANNLADDAPSIYDKYCAFLIPNNRITDFRQHILPVWQNGREIRFGSTGLIDHNCCTFTAMALRNVGIDVYCEGWFRVRDDSLLRDCINYYVRKMRKKVTQGNDGDTAMRDEWIRTYRQRDNVGAVFDIYYYYFNHIRWR